jgi:hypothetical protein
MLYHVAVLGPAHLRRILKNYAAYYNRARTHWSLRKDCPIHRRIQSAGIVKSTPALGGLHHVYARMRYSVHTGSGYSSRTKIVNDSVPIKF